MNSHLLTWETKYVCEINNFWIFMFVLFITYEKLLTAVLIKYTLEWLKCCLNYLNGLLNIT